MSLKKTMKNIIKFENALHKNGLDIPMKFVWDTVAEENHETTQEMRMAERWMTMSVNNN